MNDLKEFVTTVIDAGGRYGIHPTWSDFPGDLNYLAFEPDTEEAERLAETVTRKGYQVLSLALADRPGLRKMYFPRHRGCASFYLPDMNSEWFARYRPGEGEVDEERDVSTNTVDNVCQELGIATDFLKIDTEGSEFEVLCGASQQLAKNVIGLRTTAYFRSLYKGQKIFPAMHNFLMEKGFFLLNLDYFGRGVPAINLFGNPDPLSPDTERYGTIEGVDGVWIKRLALLLDDSNCASEHLTGTVMKFALFCMMNHAPDVGLGILLDAIAKRAVYFDADDMDSALYKGLRRYCANWLGRWRVNPSGRWREAQEIFQTIFQIELPSQHHFWEFMQQL